MGGSLALLMLGVIVGCGIVELEILRLFVGSMGQPNERSIISPRSKSGALRTQRKAGPEPSATTSAVWKYLVEELVGQGSCSMGPVDLRAQDYDVEGQVAMGQAHFLGREGDC